MPHSVPVFTVEYIIDPPPKEYEIGNKKSFVGWLKYLFLFCPCEDDSECIQIQDQDRKDYQKVLDIAWKECKIKDVDKWEETASRKKQAACLNKIRKKLGYTVEKYV